MKREEMLDRFKKELSKATGFAVEFEPSQTRRDEPCIFLSLNGFDLQGIDREKIIFSALLSVSGEGPFYFLNSAIALSRALLLLQTAEQPYLDIDIAPAFKPRATFKQTATGRFQENQEGKFKYSYMEMYRVELSYNPEKLKEI